MDDDDATSAKDIRYMIEVNGIYEKCISGLATHGITEDRSHKIFHTLYAKWGLSLLADRLSEFIEVFHQITSNATTTNDVTATIQIIEAFDEKPNDLTLYEAAMKSRSDRREAEITEIKCREESGEISSEKAQAMLTSYEHLNEWELVESS